MVTELYISPDALDFIVEPVDAPRVAPKPLPKPQAVETCEEVEPSAVRRLIIGCTRWLVVLALISVGYFSAEAISTGLAAAQDSPSTSPTLASSSQK